MEQLIFWVVQGLSIMLMTVLWYLHKERDTKIDKLSAKLQETREQYVHKDDLRELKLELGHRFDKLEELLRERKEY